MGERVRQEEREREGMVGEEAVEGEGGGGEEERKSEEVMVRGDEEEGEVEGRWRGKV